MRHNLKQARLNAGKKQREVAQALEITVRYYQNIEAGAREGKGHLWDKLETFFDGEFSQRELRENID